MIPKVKKSLPKRSAKIEAACLRAKKRDGYACLISNRTKAAGYKIEAAHVLPRNSPFSWYDPADENWIMSLWSVYHMQYDKIKKTQKKIDWLRANRLHGFADRLERYWSAN